jgi:hypothetical protein
VKLHSAEKSPPQVRERELGRCIEAAPDCRRQAVGYRSRRGATIGDVGDLLCRLSNEPDYEREAQWHYAGDEVTGARAFGIAFRIASQIGLNRAKRFA